MKPAVSIVLFTSLSGAGYGALAWLGVLHAFGELPRSILFAVISGVLSMAMIVAGLAASVFHLRHPERAWRALSQWRSSWLSREGVAALATFVPALAFLGCWILRGGGAPEVAILGLVAAACALATMVCTAMIYRSLWSVPQWSNKYTVPGFLAIGLAGGGLLVCQASVLAGSLFIPLTIQSMTIGGLCGAVAVKWEAWKMADWPNGSTTGSALGMAARIRHATPLEDPATSETWVQREMVFVIARRHARKLRRGALMVGVVTPVILIFLTAFSAGTWLADALISLAAASGLLGTLIERWLFFAEARHKVSLYHGAGEV